MKKKIPFLLLMIALSLSSKAQSDTTASKSSEKYDIILKRHDSLKAILINIKNQSNNITKYKNNKGKIDSLINLYDNLGKEIINSIGYKQPKLVKMDKNELIDNFDLLIKNKYTLGLCILGGVLLFILIWLITKGMTQNSSNNNKYIKKIKSFGIEINTVKEFLIKIVIILENESGNNKEYLIKILHGEQLKNLEFKRKYEIINNSITSVPDVEVSTKPLLSETSDIIPQISETSDNFPPIQEKIIYLSNPDTSGFFSEDTILERPDSYTYYQIVEIGNSQTKSEIHFIASKNDRALKNIIDNRTKHILPVCEALNSYDSQKHTSIKEFTAGTVIKENNGWQIKNKIKIEYV